MIIFEKSIQNRVSGSQALSNIGHTTISASALRKSKPCLPELSELEVIRHFTKLSQKNFSIDTNFYPLGSCTMKYNPRGVHKLASLEHFTALHPLAPVELCQGSLACLYELQNDITEITGMKATSLTPMAGAQGEFAGVMMIRAYHRARGDTERSEMIVQDAAHGTNPASAAMCGYTVKEVPTNAFGDIDIAALKKILSAKTAGIMLTNPSTLGLFERNILEVSKAVHEVGGLLYYDGANLNAILGKVRPGDMGFDVMHLNLHKTFATPHGGGGPGSGPVACAERLLPFLPIPRVAALQEGATTKYYWLEERDCPNTIGRLSTFMGNFGILLRAYIYTKILGREGIQRVSQFATLNANYLLCKLQEIGFTAAFPQRRASHEFILTLSKQAKSLEITALDIAKALLDEGIHAPTVYFPLLVPECLLLEPTETESKQTLDHLVQVLQKIWQTMHAEPSSIRQAPKNLACQRLDEVKAARELQLTWETAY
ncbi:MAG: aminomethyl-transferring glycine dehydrogenase subunit GcvPB [Candidatus Berkiella sp.]